MRLTRSPRRCLLSHLQQLALSRLSASRDAVAAALLRRLQVGDGPTDGVVVDGAEHRSRLHRRVRLLPTRQQLISER